MREVRRQKGRRASKVHIIFIKLPIFLILKLHSNGKDVSRKEMQNKENLRERKPSDNMHL